MGSALVGQLVGLCRRPRLRQPLFGEVGGVVKVRGLQPRRQRRWLKVKGRISVVAIEDIFYSFFGHRPQVVSVVARALRGILSEFISKNMH